jgi:hypothetical protein
MTATMMMIDDDGDATTNETSFLYQLPPLHHSTTPSVALIYKSAHNQALCHSQLVIKSYW